MNVEQDTSTQQNSAIDFSTKLMPIVDGMPDNIRKAAEYHNKLVNEGRIEELNVDFSESDLEENDDLDESIFADDDSVVNTSNFNNTNNSSFNNGATLNIVENNEEIGDLF